MTSKPLSPLGKQWEPRPERFISPFPEQHQPLFPSVLSKPGSHSLYQTLVSCRAGNAPTPAQLLKTLLEECIIWLQLAQKSSSRQHHWPGTVSIPTTAAHPCHGQNCGSEAQSWQGKRRETSQLLPPHHTLSHKLQGWQEPGLCTAGVTHQAKLWGGCCHRTQLPIHLWNC